MDWKQEVFKRLDALAEKLGTTAAYLWHVLVKQAYVEGIQDCLYVVVWIGFAVFFVWCFKKAIRAVAKDDDWMPGLIASLLAFIASGGFLLYFAGQAIGHFVNPDFYALQILRSTLEN